MRRPFSLVIAAAPSTDAAIDDKAGEADQKHRPAVVIDGVIERAKERRDHLTGNPQHKPDQREARTIIDKAQERHEKHYAAPLNSSSVRAGVSVSAAAAA